MDTTELRLAIDAFNTAAAGDFNAPDEGEWDAAMLIAHIAETARTFSDTTRDVLEAAPAAYDNAPATFEPSLRRVVQSAGSIDKLRSLALARSQELLDLMARLTDEQAATPVPVRVIDGDRVIVNATRPWSGALTTQWRIHWPAHTEALRALRA
jgi:hypothetical protein